MGPILTAVIILAVIAIAILLWACTRYRKCPSDKIMVIYGKLASKNGETVSSELFIPYSLALRMKGQSNIKANYARIQYSPDKDPDKMHRQIKDYFDNLYKNNENFTILT